MQSKKASSIELAFLYNIDVMEASIVDFQKYLDDINSPVVKQLVEDFGAEVVFSRERKFTIDDMMLTKIFDSLNKSLFGSKLPRIEMAVWSFEDIKAELVRRNIKDARHLQNTFYGVYAVSIANDNLASLKSPSEVVFADDDLLVMNVDMLTGSLFIFIVSSVCHEMIHEYVRFFGHYDQIVFDHKDDVDSIDTHQCYYFQKMMRKANQMRLNVVEKIAKPDPIMNQNAYSVLANGTPMYESKREELEKTGSVQLGDLHLYDYGRKGVICCID